MRILLPAVTALLLAQLASAQAPDDNRPIIAAADAFARAQQAGDRAILERMLAPDYLLASGSGRIVGRPAVIAGFTDPAARLQPADVTDRFFLRVSSDVAIVGGEARVHGTEGGRPFDRHYRYADTLVRRGGEWRVIYTQVTPLT